MSKFEKWWSALLYYTWFIVIWGAFVRASGSGDGCGKNWPTCHGQLIPTNSSIQTLIEYIHRATSGLYGIFVFTLVIFTLVHLKKEGLPKRILALPLLVLILTLFEALIGAKLVLSGLVGSNDSWGRAFTMIVHLVNTFVLVGCIVGVIHYFKEKRKPSSLLHLSRSLFALCTFGLVVIAALGALTALGDTLYPSDSLHHGVYQDFALNSPWILKLRILHPVFAIATVFVITWMSYDFRRVRSISLYLIISYLTLGIGLTNLLLLAPIYMQLIHLLSAQALWSYHCLLGFKLFSFENKKLI